MPTRTVTVCGQPRSVRGSPNLSVELILSDGVLVADRITATGIRKDNGQPISWIENHVYRLEDGRIKEWWPAGGPDLT